MNNKANTTKRYSYYYKPDGGFANQYSLHAVSNGEAVTDMKQITRKHAQELNSRAYGRRINSTMYISCYIDGEPVPRDEFPASK